MEHQVGVELENCLLQFSDIYQALTEMASQNEKNQKPLNPIGHLAYEK